VARPARTDPVAVCFDSDVLIAGLMSRAGASHALLVLGELGLIAVVIPHAAVGEVRRNLAEKLPEGVPLFEQFLLLAAIRIHRPRTSEEEAARGKADAKDVPILAAAIGARASILVTHNVRHFRSTSGVRVLRPRTLLEEARAWLAGLGS
jgi:predicted nucleic acid-binding protein